VDTKRYELNVQLAQMLKGGVIMDVTNVEQAKIAEEAGAVAVMALERVPADIRKQGGVARMSDPAMIMEIKKAVSIPIMAKARIGHFVEAQILEALRSIILMKVKSSPQPMKNATSTKRNFLFPLSAVPATWGRPCVGSLKARP
jgi:pyridoxal 5'-phosphate synthase subunit Pdx1